MPREPHRYKLSLVTAWRQSHCFSKDPICFPQRIIKKGTFQQSLGLDQSRMMVPRSPDRLDGRTKYGSEQRKYKSEDQHSYDNLGKGKPLLLLEHFNSTCHSNLLRSIQGSRA